MSNPITNTGCPFYLLSIVQQWAYTILWFLLLDYSIALLVFVLLFMYHATKCLQLFLPHNFCDFFYSDATSYIIHTFCIHV